MTKTIVFILAVPFLWHSVDVEKNWRVKGPEKQPDKIAARGQLWIFLILVDKIDY